MDEEPPPYKEQTNDVVFVCKFEGLKTNDFMEVGIERAIMSPLQYRS